MKRAPLIALNMDYFPHDEMPEHPLMPGRKVGLGYSKYPHYSTNLRYARAVAEAGGIPVIMPQNIADIDDFVNTVDGFLFTGGLLDLAPDTFDEGDQNAMVYIENQRATFDLTMGKKALATGKPILGICAGVQLMNVLRGGSLHQHIPDDFPDAIEHFMYTDKREYIHDVNLAKGSRLAAILGSTTVSVNSAHHMAVKRPGEGLNIVASCADGVTEAVEDPSHRFFIGVQWHPEYLEDNNQNLFRELIKAAAHD